MSISRRAFISRVLGAVAAGAVLDVDKLLWQQGAKSIFIPPSRIIIPQLFVGDIFTIDGQFAVNPVTGLSTGYLQQFVVTSNVSSGATSLNLMPAIDGQSVGVIPSGLVMPSRTWDMRG